MNTYAIRSTLISTLGVALALASGSALAISFRLTDLGTLGGPSSGAAPQRLGAGDGLLHNGRWAHAFLWDGTRMRDLGTLGGTVSPGVAINASGQVTGASDTAGGDITPSCGTARRCRTSARWGARIARALRHQRLGAGDGRLATADGSRHAFLWDGTTMLDLGTLGGDVSVALAINDSGQVTGYAHTAGDGRAHAFLWDGTTMQDLGTLGGRLVGGVAINASGQVTGSSATADGETHAFLWDGTTMLDLGTLGGSVSRGRAINASGQVTGFATTADGAVSRLPVGRHHDAGPQCPY